MAKFDVAVIGAGAAGMMCAAEAAKRGRRVVLIDHAAKLAEKIRISGGGRCNFTNINTSPANFLSENPHFCKSALSRYTPSDFLALVRKYRIAHHEKHRGQLFCDDSAERIIEMLKAECAAGDVHWRMPSKVASVEQMDDGSFYLATDTGDIECDSVVIATGGLSIPKIGASGFGYQIAEQFGLNIVPTRPALVPLTFDADTWAPFAPLSGISLEVDVETGSLKGRKPDGARFREDLLFTHRGLSGPAILQISSFWQPGAPIVINLLPEMDVAQELIEGKQTVKKQLGNVLAQWLPARLAEGLLQLHGLAADARLADMQDAVLRKLGAAINQWTITPNGSEGYRKAEVTRGGVDTRELSQQTMMVGKVPGLYFIGEAVDVTGWLGGYNFQWAWASGVAAGQAV
ncbi:NAD(P)/FAD-dependent oxidoreductase [Pseudoduganella aquatica]|uniref:Aminoacetone oxidase family FAD-binding enzyme n=1 Tax=Pseudoduganella aquatica TaxID=2660641 RepID=A0A7X4KPU1_9BURK|nr:NAD(P)/FAD-dependent oxidoreductase [Pseudoduganella aquatica]MYN09611.1 aminoacetone oxidase family FAD-binding enzyme [Pseudoduganella aquatica]